VSAEAKEKAEAAALGLLHRNLYRTGRWPDETQKEKSTVPIISKEVSVAANSNVDNVFAGSAFEFARGAQIVSLGMTQSVTGLQCQFTSGADVVVEESAPPIKTGFPVIPDEFYASDIAAPGDRYVLRARNTTAGAITLRAVLQIQDVG